MLLFDNVLARKLKEFLLHYCILSPPPGRSPHYPLNPYFFSNFDPKKNVFHVIHKKICHVSSGFAIGSNKIFASGLFWKISRKTCINSQ